MSIYPPRLGATLDTAYSAESPTLKAAMGASSKLAASIKWLFETGSALGRVGQDGLDLARLFHARGILRASEKRFPEVYAQLDNGDREVMRAFPDASALVNVLSVLGTRRAPLRQGDGELAIGLRESLTYLADMFGPDAALGPTPELVVQHGADDGPERWFFVNGIATNLATAVRNAQCLQRIFGRPVTIIYNPTQGFVEDLAESALQKFTNINTEVVARAFLAISEALLNPHVKHVRVVGHSQGTIILGDVLDLLYYALCPEDFFDFTNMNGKEAESFFETSHGIISADALKLARQQLRAELGIGQPLKNGQQTQEKKRRRALLEKLELYLFANCASRMCYRYEDAQGVAPHIESFANEHDVIARLGCLAKDALHRKDLIRIDGPVFLGKGRVGHLLNAHYLTPLLEDFRVETGHYVRLEAKEGSTCVGDSVMAEVRGNPCSLNPRSRRGRAEPSKLFALFADRQKKTKVDVQAHA
jgi:hypothetical protein